MSHWLFGEEVKQKSVQAGKTAEMNQAIAEAESRGETVIVAKPKRRRPMPTNMTNAFEPGWRPPRPWHFSLADPIYAAELEEARKQR